MTDLADIRGPARETRNAGPVVVGDAPVSVEPAPEPASVAKLAPEPAAPPPAPASAPDSSSGGGFFPLFLGGVAAALIGFALATFAVPDGWPRPEEPDPEIRSRLSALEENFGTVAGRLDMLEQSVAEAAVAPQPDTGLEAAVETLGGELETLRSEVAELSGNISDAGGPAPEMPDFTGAFNDQMAAFQAEVDRVTRAAEEEAAAARAEAEAVRAAAAQAERQAELRATAAEIEIALDTGAPFADALAGLDGVEVPAGLSDVAEDGIAPLSQLQRSFPEAARSALQAAARGPAEGAGAVERVAAFLLNQTNARSLQPREGDDADAILSRAEAALGTGDLGAALGELRALDDGPAAALGAWLERAEVRQAALDALETLSGSIDAM
ncbi:MAG: hypothetical protein QNJ13_16500 [Paracoccaceae bacterium]|nr:hypothetical protein [Paracoccaceae bacterium]